MLVELRVPILLCFRTYLKSKIKTKKRTKTNNKGQRRDETDTVWCDAAPERKHPPMKWTDPTDITHHGICCRTVNETLPQTKDKRSRCNSDSSRFKAFYIKTKCFSSNSTAHVFLTSVQHGTDWGRCFHWSEPLCERQLRLFSDSNLINANALTFTASIQHRWRWRL